MATKVILICCGIVMVAALLFGQTSTAQGEWEMISQRVSAGAGGGQSPFAGNNAVGEVFLYNKRSGTVYVRGNCGVGTSSESPCFWRLPVSDERSDWHTIPTPQNYGSGQSQ